MRLIDGDELLARYKARCEGCKETKNYCEHCCDIADIINDIEDAPTIEERKKGKWIEKWNGHFKTNVPRCSLCSNASPFKYNYCPTCGAEMENKNDT